MRKLDKVQIIQKIARIEKNCKLKIRIGGVQTYRFQSDRFFNIEVDDKEELLRF